MNYKISMFIRLKDMDRKIVKNSKEKNIRKKGLGDWTKNQVKFLEIKSITIVI